MYQGEDGKEHTKVLAFVDLDLLHTTQFGVLVASLFVVGLHLDAKLVAAGLGDAGQDDESDDLSHVSNGG